jgi:hypothetical protein
VRAVVTVDSRTAGPDERHVHKVVPSLCTGEVDTGETAWGKECGPHPRACDLIRLVSSLTWL